eukprot:m.124425 g.124425  ORF g.124425 m.124425 type:complete len:966 (+) comp16621_c0_seq4:1402-4299(+)
MAAAVAGSDRRVQALAHGVVARLRSGVALPSFSQCVEELVLNSIDAGAHRITVAVDVARCRIKVEDDGRGVAYDDLRMLGTRYATSKCQSLDNVLVGDLPHHGFRGEALASLQELGVLEVVTRPEGSAATFAKILSHGTVVSLGPSIRPLSRPGTTVTVRDLFANLPVRQKALCPKLELEQVRHRIEAIALANPRVAFLLQNSDTGSQLLRTEPAVSNAAVFSQLFGARRARDLRLVSGGTANKAASFNPTFSAAPCSTMQLQGCVSTSSFHNKSLQFLYVNGRLLRKTDLHRFVESIFAGSLLGRRLPSTMTGEGPNISSSPYRYPVYCLNLSLPTTEYTILLEPSKATAAFKDYEAVLGCVTATLNAFLKRHGLALQSDDPPAMAKPSDAQDGSDAAYDSTRLAETLLPFLYKAPASTSAAVASRSVRRPVAKAASAAAALGQEVGSKRKEVGSKRKGPSNDNDNDSRNKPGVGPVPAKTCSPTNGSSRSQRGTTEAKAAAATPCAVSLASAALPGVERQVSCWRSLLGDDDDSDVMATMDVSPSDVDHPASVSTRVVTMLVPASSKTRRSGSTRSSSAPASAMCGRSATPDELLVDSTHQGAERISKRRRVASTASDDLSGNVPKVSPSESTEEPKKLTCESKLRQMLTQWKQETVIENNHQAQLVPMLSSKAITRPLKFDRDTLDRMEVMCQVDCKFIFCLVRNHGPNSTDMLVALDQHAADERICLEKLIQGLYEPGSQRIKFLQLEPPVRLSMPASDGRLLERFKPQFRRWGVDVRVLPTSAEGPDGMASIAVFSVPRALLLAEPDEPEDSRAAVSLERISTFLREQLTLLTTTGGATMGAVPQCIVRLLASRACHSAIRFGDKLSVDECRKMVSSLSECRLPFQCAHGRPSIVPVTDLGALMQQSDNDHSYQAQPTPICGTDDESDASDDSVPSAAAALRFRRLVQLKRQADKSMGSS